MSGAPLSPERPPREWRDAIRAGDRRAMARAITLLESTREDHAAFAQRLLDALVPDSGGAIRVGVSGPPGVGKSHLIEALGLMLVERGLRVAVLAVDPSSPVTGGSILGDKTRMEKLSRREEAFIRPSPSGGSLGGVAQRTREAIIVCEAAGFDVVLVETVGIGQSEVTVASMVDFFLVILAPGGGDELQGIKKGVIELADTVVVNKADGDTLAIAERTRTSYSSALDLLRPARGWRPRALTASARTGAGIPELWQTVEEHRALCQADGSLQQRRRRQARDWMWALVEEGLRRAFQGHPAVRERIGGLERDVEALKTTPAAAARVLLEAFEKSR
jgi:LAO/AO transport system kinase